MPIKSRPHKATREISLTKILQLQWPNVAVKSSRALAFNGIVGVHSNYTAKPRHKHTVYTDLFVV